MTWIEPVQLARRIQMLTDVEFADLCNRVIAEAGAQHGIARACFAFNLSIDEPDGGIDARCIAAPTTVGRLIPRTDVVYQYKSGSRSKSANQVASEDIIEKPRVRDALARGAAFVYLMASDRGDAFEGQVTATARRAGLTVDDDQIVCIGAHTIAHLLVDLPALVFALEGGHPSIISLAEWSQRPSVSNPFVADDALAAQQATLRTLISASNAPVRVVGAAGNGKTRTVLETLRTSELSDSVLYAPEPSAETSAFISRLVRLPGVRCTLVIDDVNDTEATRLAEQVGTAASGLRLVTIGLDAAGRALSDTVQLPGFSDELLAAIIETIVPGLAPELPRSIARACARSPKLAVVIANRIRQDPALAAPHRYLTDGRVRTVLERYLGVDPSDLSWQAMAAVSLLSAVGWSKDRASESEVLFTALGLEPSTARRAVLDLHDRLGVAPAAGRLRYVSPDVLADHLASRLIESWTGGQVRKFFTALTPQMAERFARRARRLASSLEDRATIEEALLGPEGPFASLTDLEDEQRAQTLRRLAGPFSRATLGALFRVIHSASREDLRSASRSRRNLVWALEELLWREDTFGMTSDLLLQLALAENETVGNNATQTWISTYQTFLGRTAAGWFARSRNLQKSASSADPLERQLAALALGAALKMGQLSRSGGGPPTDVEGMPAVEWSPATWSEWAEAALSYLKILRPLLVDPETPVRQAAIDALAAGLDTSVQLPEVFESWMAAAHDLLTTPFPLPSSFVSALESGLQRWRRWRAEEKFSDGADASLTDEQRADGAARLDEKLRQLEALYNELRGDGFSARFRWTLTRTPFNEADVSDREEARERIQERIAAMAEEVVGDPSLMDGEWEWLTETESWHGADRWITFLGRADRERVFEPTIATLAAASQNPAVRMWLSLYDLEYARAHPEAGFIERRAAELRGRGADPMQVFDLLYRAGPTAERLDLVLEMLRSRSVPGSVVTNLAFLPWGPTLSVDDAVTLARTAAQDPEATPYVTRFIAQYLEHVNDARNEFRDLALDLLVPSSGVTPEPTEDWADLALLYASREPVSIAAAAIRALEERDHFANSRAVEVLSGAWAVDKDAVFREVIGPWIDTPSLEGWLLPRRMQGFPLAELGPAALATWIAQKPDRRAYVVASLVGPPYEQVTDVQAMLLTDFAAHGVGDTFSAAFRSGMCIGSAAAWNRSKLARAQQWLTDDRPAVREYARELVQILEEEIRRCEEREDEEGALRW